MGKTKLSSKGQVVIPKSTREKYGWKPGQELYVKETGDGIVLMAPPAIPETSIDKVAGCLSYEGPRVAIEQMDEAIETKMRERSEGTE